MAFWRIGLRRRNSHRVNAWQTVGGHGLTRVINSIHAHLVHDVQVYDVLLHVFPDWIAFVSCLYRVVCKVKSQKSTPASRLHAVEPRQASNSNVLPGVKENRDVIVIDDYPSASDETHISRSHTPCPSRTHICMRAMMSFCFAVLYGFARRRTQPP